MTLVLQVLLLLTVVVSTVAAVLEHQAAAEAAPLLGSMATQVRLEAVLRREGLVAGVREVGASVRLLACVCPHVRLEVVTGGKGLATTVLLTTIRLLACVGARVLAQVTQCREELEAPALEAVEGVA